MRHFLMMLAASVTLTTTALAQEQQAGNDASARADETFKKLIEQCDNTDVLVLRARIRLALGRTTDAARDEASKMLDQGMATCGEGKIDEAKAQLKKAEEIAQAGVTEKFGQDASAETKPTAAKAEDAKDSDAKSDVTAEKKPWWKFW